jgi:acylphosphatase
MKRVRVKIFGDVQGVFFRSTTKEKADELGIKGWVRNASDGSVEASFEGKDKAIDEIVEWCEEGPAGAKVDKIEVKGEKFKNEFKEFSIIY